MVSKAIRMWDNYWKRGELHSCISASGDENQREINDFWRGIYAGYDDDAVMLDIGTGNGLLPSLAAAYANDQAYGWEIHGVDLADINPARDVPDQRELLDQINFQGRIAAEQLPFADGYFDLVTSQYAIEYSDMARSVPEVARVLKPGGIFCAVLHSHHSLVVRQNGDKIADLDFILRSGVLQKCKDMLIQYRELDHSGNKGSRAKDIKYLIDSYVENIKNLDQRYPPGKAPEIILQVQQGLFDVIKYSAKYRLDENLQIIDNAFESLEKQKILLLNLAKSALDDKQIEELMESLSKIGFNEIKENKFYNGFERNLIGIYITARKE